MRALKVAVMVMGVLIVLGTVGWWSGSCGGRRRRWLCRGRMAGDGGGGAG